MKNIILLFVIFTQTVCANEEQKADESNVVKVPLAEIISDAQNLFSLSSSLKVYQRDKPVDLTSLNFLFGEANTSSLERLSESYKSRLDELERNGGIPRAQYYDQYELRGSEPSKVKISFKIRGVDGWGYLKTQVANEIFLLQRNLKGATPFLRITPKKTEEWHIARLSRIYPSPENDKPFLLKLNKNTWIHVYRMVAPLNDKDQSEYRFGKIYFEKYGKSIEMFTESDIDLGNWLDFVTRFGENVVEKVEQIGIYPDPNSIELVSQKRLKLFGNSLTPSYVLGANDLPAKSPRTNVPKLPREKPVTSVTDAVSNESQGLASDDKNDLHKKSYNKYWIIGAILLVVIILFFMLRRKLFGK